jgi:dihydrofolate synthase/folylpolyglutamate synthase
MQKILKPEATSPLATWLHYLEHLHGTAIELGLERAKSVGQGLDLLKPAPFVITVAGTNGKGTTCRTLEAILMAAGYQVGVYSSPHLIRYTERVRIQGKELPELKHSEALSVIENGRGSISLTYFEFGTLSALYLFKQAALDVVILEVGLGGRLDATNIVDADVAVITSIALDHTDWLGNDRESIGREKAGIFRQGRPAVVGEPEMPTSIANFAAEIGAQLFCRGKDWRYQSQNGVWRWLSDDRNYLDLPEPAVPLANAATALAALAVSGLSISEQAVRQGITQAELPGRFQTVQQSPRVILDVAHNPHAAAYLAEKLSALPLSGGKLRAVVGMLVDKDIAGTLACLAPVIDKWYCAPLSGPRGTSAADIARYLPDAMQFLSVKEAWQKAQKDAAPQDTIIVFGSFHTVAEVMEVLDTGEFHG